jgi:3-phenylpropionate/trans-cinnamate dioxygenase ferredoxin reductase subunit
MSALDRYVIIGAALAGAKTAQALREQGFEGQIVLIGQESTFPYERPELSKGYLTGKTERQKLFVHEAAWYAENQVELRLDTTVRAIDRAAHEVELADGTALHYDKLLLSTGARPRRIDLTGADAKGVYYLRTVEQSQQLRELFARIKRLVVIGAGWIGLEVTAAARAAGVAVTVFESARLPLLNVLGPEAAQVFAELHAANGVDLRFGATLAEITVADGQATGVRLEDGTRVESDAVLVAVGAAPNVDLAEAAGLRVDNGVIVDAALRTDDPDIFAAGDVANAFHPFYDKQLRVEHWANALKQPATAAAAMLGHEASYTELPYFYSDQYDLGMEFVGLVEPGGYSDVVFRGDLLGREFIAFWLSEGRVIAGMNVNVWDVTDAIKDLIRSRRPIDPVRLANPEVPLDSL